MYCFPVSSTRSLPSAFINPVYPSELTNILFSLIRSNILTFPSLFISAFPLIVHSLLIRKSDKIFTSAMSTVISEFRSPLIVLSLNAPCACIAKQLTRTAAAANDLNIFIIFILSASFMKF